MGTKRQSWTQYDTLLNQSNADRPHQPDRRVPAVASQRAPGTTGPSDRGRGRLPEEERRGARELERMKDNPRNKRKDGESMEWQAGSELAPTPRTRGGEREWTERERHRVEERLRNGRPVSHLDPGIEYDMDKGAGKGGTFPRMRKRSKERPTIMTALREEEMDRDRKGPTERHKRTESDRETEREMERARRTERHDHRERYRERERDGVRPRLKDEGGRRTREERTLPPRERRRDPDQGYSERRREREGDASGLRDRREREIARERERSKPRSGDRVRKAHSPHRREGEVYSERDTWDRAKARGGMRESKSEGDTDGGGGRQRARDSDREAYHPSRSEGENRDRAMRKNGRDQPRYRDDERQRHREGRDGPRRQESAIGTERTRDQYRERDGRRERDFAGEPRWKDDAVGDRKERRPDSRQRPSDRRESEQYRHRGEEKKQQEEGRYRERAAAAAAEEERRYRENQERPAVWHQGDPTGSTGRPASKAAPEASPQGRSSGEWSSDLDSESRAVWTRDSHEEKESEGDSTAESDRDAGRDSSDMEAVQRRDDELRSAGGSGHGQEHRRMWLEPQRRKCSNDSSLEDELVEMNTRRQPDKALGLEGRSGSDGGEGSGRQPEEHYGSLEGGRRVDRPSDPEGESEGVSVDAEEEEDEAGGKRSPRDLGQGHGKDGARRGDIEAGSDCPRSESEGWSDPGWDLGRDKRFSGEDGFITVSSGSDEEDEREDDEFEDCRESWEEGHPGRGPHPASLRGGEKTGRHGRQSGAKEYRIEEGEEEGEDRQRTSPSPLPDGGAKSTKHAFCVIGQPPAHTQRRELEKVEAGVPGRRPGDETATRPRSDSHPALFGSAADRGDLQTRTTARSLSASATGNPPSDDERESDLEHPYAEIGAVGRDVRTEMLLAQWREKHKEYSEWPEVHLLQEDSEGIAARTRGDAAAQQGNSVPAPTLPQATDPEAVGPGEEEQEEEEQQEVSIRIRMSGAWSMEEEAKRRSQAPHLKWANSVMREILGSSEDRTLDADASGPRTEARPEGDAGPDAVTQAPQGSDQESEADEGRTGTPDSDELRGRAQSGGGMHAEPADDMHGDTPAYTHTHTRVVVQGPESHGDPEAGVPAGGPGEGEEDGDVRREEVEAEETPAHEEATRETEAEMYLSVSHVLYKPRSCPCLNYDTEECPLRGDAATAQHDSDQEGARRAGEGEPGMEEQAAKESFGGVMSGCRGSGSEWSEEDQVKEEGGEVAGPAPGREVREVLLTSSCSFRDLGPEARVRRRGIRKTTERRKEERVEEEEEEEGAGRDRRTRIFSTTDDPDPISKSWSELELRTVLEAVGQTKRFFNAGPLYQQYSEDAQNSEILQQSQFDAEHPADPLPSGPPVSAPAATAAPASRPLPPLPPVPHPHSLSIPAPGSRGSGSARNLPLPETPKPQSRSPSPRLSISLDKKNILWQELPGVKNSAELSQLSMDHRRLQEVRFEVVHSEASYCRTLNIVVEHFVKSKQLGALLTTQDSNWLFSRFADVRAISHSFLSKLEEKVESDILHFTVCDVIARHCQRFKMVYVPYLTNQSYQDATYQRLMNENQRFKRLVEKLERSPACHRLTLRSFLILPFQRITRIKLLVQNIVKRTAPGTEEAVQAIKVLKLLEKMIRESNESISQMKSIESLVSLSAMADFECKTLPLVSQSRRLVREGPVTELMEFSVKDTERKIYLHLFNDHLLLSLHKEGGRFTVIDHSPVSDVRAENCRVKLHSLQKNLFRLHLSQRALLLRTDTQSDKLRWISAISKPHPVLDFAAAQDFTQMQCIRAFFAQQPDELSLEKADVILVHQESGDGWVEGTKLSDRHRGWMPAAHLENINNAGVCERNLLDALKLTTATAAV